MTGEASMNIAGNAVVTLRMRVLGLDGEVVDEGTEPFRYLHGGHGGLFAKVEAALDGKVAGDSIQVTLEPADAFGERAPELVTTAPLDHFASPPRPGDEVERDYGGVSLAYRVTVVDTHKVELDANHPLAGMTLVFSATVLDVRPATPEEVASEISGLAKAVAEGKLTERAFARAKADAEAEAEAADLAKAEAADLVESVYVPQLGTRLRFVFRSQTHKLCWLAPLFLLPALAVWLLERGFENACAAVMLLFVAWCFFAPAVIRKAIDRWGYRFLFFDFSPNLNPSRLESSIVNGSAVLSVLAVLGCTIIALFRMEHLSDLWSILGADLALVLVLGILLAILLPFLVIVLTAFRVRPIIDKAPAK